MGETQEQVLARIFEALKGEEDARQLAAIEELGTLNYSSPAILHRLEFLALAGSTQAVREAAYDALGLNIHRFIQSQVNKINQSNRRVVLQEIQSWSEQGLIDPERAKVLAHRYNYDMAQVVPPAPSAGAIKNPTLQPAPSSRPPSPSPQVETPAGSQAEPAEPPLTLSERLLSQTTVNIALYLGAFLVIGAAVILAYLVEVTRLPILLGVTILFAGGSLAIKKRLPQPSFTLSIVFSFLLPINAIVIQQTSNFSGRDADAYWAIVFFFMTLLWGFSTWFYSSRFFSIASFVTFSLAILRFGSIFNAPDEWIIFNLMIASLIGLAGVYLLRGWKNSEFALPLFITVQLLGCLTLLSSFGFAVFNLVNQEAGTSVWLLTSLTWIVAAGFYAWSGFLFEFPLFEWAAVTALLPVSWLILKSFNAPAVNQIIGLWFWGTIFSFFSEIFGRRAAGKGGDYYWPFLSGTLPLFAASALWALLENAIHDAPITYTFGALLGGAIIYLIFMILRPRGYLWLTDLVFGLAAYFTFFTLPFIKPANIPAAYQFLGASLLLLVPELFFKSSLTTRESWRWPLVLLGSFVSLGALSVILTQNDMGVTAICFGVYTFLFAALAFHFKRSVLGYLATASAALSLFYALKRFDLDLWLPFLTALAVIYFAAGYFLRKDERSRAWASMLRSSGLALGAIISLAALVTLKPTGGWYALATGAMFAAEIFIRPDDRLESGSPFFLSIAAFLILHDYKINALPYHLLAISLIWLAADAVYTRLIATRRLSIATRVIGGALASGNAIYLLATPGNSKQAAICFAIYAVFFAFYAWYYQKPILGYAATISLPLCTFFTLQTMHWNNWLYEIIAIAIIYYVAGFVLRRQRSTGGWSQMLLFSGLGLGVLNSISAPLHVGLDAAIPVALAATLYAIEAFERRNVWLAFPANLLYLESYFLILTWLKVDQPQFFSVGAAVLGMLMHYLLARAKSKTGAFIMGLVSQLVLLGTTYIQMVAQLNLSFFFVLFFQSLAVLAYGIVMRSRSLVIAPISFAVLGVLTVVGYALRTLSLVVIIGATGIALLLLGILAAVMRERITTFAERFRDWQA